MLAIAGPTASGKTSAAVDLALMLETEVISFDSRQFYQEMFIGTAVPTTEERKGVTHHFIQHRTIHEEYSVAGFVEDAHRKLSELFRKYPVVVAVGGSGLYLQALAEGLDDIPEVQQEVREKLEDQLKSQGLTPLLANLEQLDPDTFARIDRHNPRRVLRALEVCLSTGKAFSSFLNKQKEPPGFETITLVLCPERACLYQRINARTLEMMKAGWMEEAKDLLPFRHLNALNTLGYKEIFLHLEGQLSLEGAISEIQKNTRRYAKRQTTWFKKQIPEPHRWFPQSRDLLDYASRSIVFPGAG